MFMSMFHVQAEETVDAAIRACSLEPKNGCVTAGLNQFPIEAFVTCIQA